MDFDGAKNGLMKEIQELEGEIKDFEESIPAHSMRFEIIQLLYFACHSGPDPESSIAELDSGWSLPPS